ncbi:MAG: recombinase family protein [Flavonifractor plautii]
MAGLYVDDGWSGTSFDRPEFRRMLRDIEAGRVNMVITKDLSRLGRDYIMTGHYMERYFPEHRVRYISLLDGIDTGVDSSANEITPFRAIMNDMYAKDISKDLQRQGTNSERGCLSAASRYMAIRCTLRKRTKCGGRGAAPVARRIFGWRWRA